jgi:hypothetical protein
VARPRIDDVARRAGVSKTAVSFAFNQPEHLNAATRERILAAATELGYRPSPIARRLARAAPTRSAWWCRSRRTTSSPTRSSRAGPRHRRRLRRGGHRGRDRSPGRRLDRAGRGRRPGRRPDPARPGPEHPDLGEVGARARRWSALDIDGASTTSRRRSASTTATALASRRGAPPRLGHRDVAVVLIAEHPDSPVDERHGISAPPPGRHPRRLRPPAGEDEAADGRSACASCRPRCRGGRTRGVPALRRRRPADRGHHDVRRHRHRDPDRGGRQPASQVPDDLSVVGFDDIPAASWTTPTAHDRPPTDPGEGTSGGASGSSTPPAPVTGTTRGRRSCRRASWCAARPPLRRGREVSHLTILIDDSPPRDHNESTWRNRPTITSLEEDQP